MSGAAWLDPALRWLILAPAGAAPVQKDQQYQAVRTIRALRGGTPVAVVGRRGLKSLGRQAEIDVAAVYVALPGVATPVAVTGSPAGLRWVARCVLTVPSGRCRGYFATTVATRLVRRAPWVLWLVGDRILVGTKR